MNQVSEEDLEEMTQGTKQCPSCGRLTPRGRKTCRWCHAHIVPDRSDMEIVGTKFTKLFED